MTRYAEQLNECTDPTSGDFLTIYNASAGSTDKDQKVDINKFAILANAQTFTGAQTFTPSGTGTNAIKVDMVASNTAYAYMAYYNAVYRYGVYQRSALSLIELVSADLGNTIAVPYVSIGRNSNATVPSAGSLQLFNRSGTAYSLWVDASANLRIHTAAPASAANDTSGTIVGNQTSYIGVKEDIEEWTDQRQALDAVLACKLFQYHLRGDETKRQYSGLIITDEDRGAWFSENDADNQTPALNERNLFGYLIAAIQEQQKQIRALQAQVEGITHAN